jgi:hypothetical protein
MPIPQAVNTAIMSVENNAEGTKLYLIGHVNLTSSTVLLLSYHKKIIVSLLSMYILQKNTDFFLSDRGT